MTFATFSPAQSFFLHHFVNAVIARRNRPTLVEISGSKASVPCQRSMGFAEKRNATTTASQGERYE